MLPFKRTNTSALTPSASPSLIEVADQAARDLAAALNNDPEVSRLRAIIADIRVKRDAAEAELQRVGLARAEVFNARARQSSIEAAALELLSDGALAAHMPVNDEAVAEAHRVIKVFTEALRIAGQQIAARSRVIAAEITDAAVRQAVRDVQRSAALYLARAMGAYAQVFIANETLANRGFGADPIGTVWKPFELFGFATDMYSAPARALRDAIADGLLTEDEAVEAVGSFPGSMTVVTGRTPAPALPAGYVAPPPTPYIPSPPPVRYRETIRGLVRLPNDEASIIPS